MARRAQESSRRPDPAPLIPDGPRNPPKTDAQKHTDEAKRLTGEADKLREGAKIEARRGNEREHDELIAKAKDLEKQAAVAARAAVEPPSPPAPKPAAQRSSADITGSTPQVSTGTQTAKAGQDAYLNMAQLAYYASRAGFQGDALKNIVAIAWAESGGKINAVGDGGNSDGLLQIYAPAHPGLDRARLTSDPQYAFEQAFKISGGGTNLSPWTTWTGATQAGKQADAHQYLNDAATAVQGMQGASAAGGAIDTTPALRPGNSAPTTTRAGTSSQSDLTGGTTTSAATQHEDLPVNATPAQIESYIQHNFPQAAPYLSNPEIRALLLTPNIDQMDDIAVEALLRKTNYWQTHGPDSRAFDAVIARKDGSAEKLIGQAEGIIRDQFALSGVEADDAKIGEVAKSAIRAGWIDTSGRVVDQASLDDFQAFALGKQGHLGGGSAGANADALGMIAQKYGVKIPRPALEDWSLRLMQGTATEQTFTKYVSDQAAENFHYDPNVLDALKRGVTPATYFAPHQQAIADTLGLGKDEVDIFNDPKWSQVTQFFDPQTGKVRAMTKPEAINLARHDPRFKQTHEYEDTQAKWTLGLQDFLATAK